MSKKIDAALKELKKALNKHAEVVGAPTVSLKKAQRAGARVLEALENYALLVEQKSGIESPLRGIVRPGLEAATIASLTAERDRIAENLTGPVPVQEASAETRTAAL
jgi:hypothetical protein